MWCEVWGQVTFTYPLGNTATIDLDSNYWFDDGTPAQLDSLIYDGNDDPELHDLCELRSDPNRAGPCQEDVFRRDQGPKPVDAGSEIRVPLRIHRMTMIALMLV